MATGELISLRLDTGVGESVPFASLVAVLPAWQALLNAFVTAYSDVDDADWQIVRLQEGSAEVGLVAGYEDPSSASDPLAGVVPALVASSREIAHGADPVDVLPDAAIPPFRRVTQVLEDRVLSISIVSGEQKVELTSDPFRSRSLAVVRSRSVGTIGGTLQGVFFGQRSSHATVRPNRGSRQIKIYFDDESQSGLVIPLLRKEVEVRGRIVRGEDDRIQKMERLHSIEALAPEADLPPISSLIGIVPDLTEGLPSEEWLRRRRDAS